jgi:antitoxin (DNA-binding transcriptional repressor) of toxin-antitoxin stability system
MPRPPRKVPALPDPTIRVITISVAQATLAKLADESQQRPICLTRYGRPVALLIGVAGQDLIGLIQRWQAPPPPRTKAR